MRNPVTLFTELGLAPELEKALASINFSETTDVQQQAIPQALAGKDLMVSAKTGSGKTAAFLLPMLHHFLSSPKPNSDTRGLILLPTRELALQTQKTFQQLTRFCSIKSGLIIGGEAFKYQVATLRKNPEVIIATPGRLVEHIDKGNTYLTELEVLVLDEADRMLDMGFAEDMNTIASACHKDRQTLLYSATLGHKGIKQVKGVLNDPEIIKLDDHRTQLENIEQLVVLADEDEHKQKLVVNIVNKENAERVFVFCKTREQTNKLTNFLKYKDIKAECIHGEIPQSERKQVMNRFRSGHLNVLVATDVAARGLDIPETDLVINFSVAQSGDDHVHRVGRTGRAGATGKVVTLVNSLEWNLLASIERYLKQKFIRTKNYGLNAKFSGPKKLKKSGKAASTKKKPAKKTLAKGKHGSKTSNKKPLKQEASNSEDGDLAIKPAFKVSKDGMGGLRRRKN